ncbi:MAG: hypothetical protein WCP12_11475 [bacterium]
MIRIHLIVVASIGCLSIVQAETKLTPLKTGGGRSLESIKAKKAPQVSLPSWGPSPKEETPPAPVFSGSKSGWGIVNEVCAYYSLEGHNMGKLPVGTMLTYSGVKQSTKSFVLISKIQRQEKTWEGPFLIEASDVVIYRGELEKMPDKLMGDLKAYYVIKGQIADRKDQIEEKTLSLNPHFDTAKLWQQRYAESIEKAGKMEEKANVLTGSAKSNMLDALRSLKYEQTRIKTQADNEAMNYKAWKDQHPINPALFNNDAELKVLQTQLKEAKAKIKDMGVE